MNYVNPFTGHFIINHPGHEDQSVHGRKAINDRIDTYGNRMLEKTSRDSEESKEAQNRARVVLSRRIRKKAKKVKKGLYPGFGDRVRDL